jgi:curved DNA-binding protein CbpA
MIHDGGYLHHDSMNEGQLQQNPLAELIRETADKAASGALRLARKRAKVVIYFENGAIVFAASNLRAQRLSEFLKRSQILADKQLAELPANATDEELANLLVQREIMKPEALGTIRASHVSEILRSTLLWTDGDWQFDSRIRVAGDTRVTIDTKRLLLESARRLSAADIASRFCEQTETLEMTQSNGYSAQLLPAEAFVLSRLTGTTALNELLAVSGLSEEETLRAVYGLAMAGLVQRSAWPTVEISSGPGPAEKPPLAAAKQSKDVGNVNEKIDLQTLFTRLDEASNHYDVLGIGRHASAEEVKQAYHTLARRYHPDRFHQSEAELRGRVDSAFARIARAYELLADQTSRAAYDAQYTAQSSADQASSPSETVRAAPSAKRSGGERAESSFQQGLAALQQNQAEPALRFFAEAASLEPRRARYRAHYGRALIDNPKTRRAAEIELKAAIALEPENTSYRLMLAELYKALGLRRRAEGEIKRALVADPKNEAARSLLSSLKK